MLRLILVVAVGVHAVKQEAASLFPGSKHSVQARNDAVLRALAFLEDHSKTNFKARARDYMLGMKLISKGFLDPQVSSSATDIGNRFAQQWTELYPDMPQLAPNDPDALRMLIGDVFNAGRLGVSIPSTFMEKLHAEAKRLGFNRFFSFDARVQPPQVKAQGQSRFATPWDEWQNALIFAYVCERMGLDVGITFFDVLKWLPHMKPYQADPNADFTMYATQLSSVAHIVYTLNDYDNRNLDPALLPQETVFLQDALMRAVDEWGIAEAVGEVVDCLKALGQHETSSSYVAKGVEFLMDTQNADGSWGLPEEVEMGTVYHTTIVAIWGLRDTERATEHGPIFPELTAVLDQWARLQPWPQTQQQTSFVTPPVQMPYGGQPYMPPHMPHTHSTSYPSYMPHMPATPTTPYMPYPHMSYPHMPYPNPSAAPPQGVPQAAYGVPTAGMAPLYMPYAQTPPTQAYSQPPAFGNPPQQQQPHMHPTMQPSVAPAQMAQPSPAALSQHMQAMGLPPEMQSQVQALMASPQVQGLLTDPTIAAKLQDMLKDSNVMEEVQRRLQDPQQVEAAMASVSMMSSSPDVVKEHLRTASTSNNAAKDEL